MDWLLSSSILQPSQISNDTKKKNTKKKASTFLTTIRSFAFAERQCAGQGVRLFVQACVLSGCDYVVNTISGVGLVHVFSLVNQHSHVAADKRFHTILQSKAVSVRTWYFTFYHTYTTISALLDEIWDGHVATFPSFIVALRLRSQEGKWNAAAPHGILSFPTGVGTATNNILTDYHSIADAQIVTARTARVDQRSIQNAKAMFNCVKGSIKGALKATIFTQFGNMPTHSDGTALFKTLTGFTTVASLQLSMLSFQNILEFNPVDRNSTFRPSMVN